MNNDFRIGLDTNVIISAMLIKNSLPSVALSLGLAKGAILVSHELVEELNDVISRKKFSRYITSEERETFLQALVAESHLVDIKQRFDVCRDPKDNQVLNLAINGNANFIVSGDNDLLVIHPFRKVSILTPANFIEIVHGLAH